MPRHSLFFLSLLVFETLFRYTLDTLTPASPSVLGGRNTTLAARKRCGDMTGDCYHGTSYIKGDDKPPCNFCSSNMIFRAYLHH